MAFSSTSHTWHWTIFREVVIPRFILRRRENLEELFFSRSAPIGESKRAGPGQVQSALATHDREPLGVSDCLNSRNRAWTFRVEHCRIRFPGSGSGASLIGEPEGSDLLRFSGRIRRKWESTPRREEASGRLPRTGSVGGSDVAGSGETREDLLRGERGKVRDLAVMFLSPPVP